MRLKAPADQHQLCLSHQIRALQGLIDKRPRRKRAYEMQNLFRTAIHLGHRRDTLTPGGFRRQVTILHRRWDRLLKRPLAGKRRPHSGQACLAFPCAIKGVSSYAKPAIPDWAYRVMGWERRMRWAKDYGAMKLLKRRSYLTKAK